MGQRLVVSIIKNAKEIAAIYYHWSAYTISSLYEAQEIIDGLNNITIERSFKNLSDIEQMQIKLIRFCERNGGCVDGGGDSNEAKKIKEMFPGINLKLDGSRNKGLIALTEDGIHQLKSWSEGDLTIDLDNETISCYVNWEYDNINDYNADRIDCGDDRKELSDIDKISYPFEDLNFCDISNLIYQLEESEDFVVRYGNVIYQLVA